MKQHRFRLSPCRISFSLVLVTACVMSVPGLLHAGEWIEGRVTHVRDLETIDVNGLPVRLNGVDGPELDQPRGHAGKRWMQRQVLRKPVKCWLTGAKTYDRWVGTCQDANGRDIGAPAIASGSRGDISRKDYGSALTGDVEFGMTDLAATCAWGLPDEEEEYYITVGRKYSHWSYRHGEHGFDRDTLEFVNDRVVSISTDG